MQCIAKQGEYLTIKVDESKSDNDENVDTLNAMISKYMDPNELY